VVFKVRMGSIEGEREKRENEKETKTNRRSRPFRAHRRPQLVLVLRRRSVRERQVLEHVLGRLFVLLLADDDMVEFGVLTLVSVDTGDLGNELARVLELLRSLTAPRTLREERKSQRSGGTAEKRRKKTNPSGKSVVLLLRRVALDLLALSLLKVL
jgi:hypothetical protein